MPQCGLDFFSSLMLKFEAYHRSAWVKDLRISKTMLDQHWLTD